VVGKDGDLCRLAGHQCHNSISMDKHAWYAYTAWADYEFQKAAECKWLIVTVTGNHTSMRSERNSTVSIRTHCKHGNPMAKWVKNILNMLVLSHWRDDLKSLWVWIMFWNHKIVGRQTKSEPEAATNFLPDDRQYPAKESRLNAMPFDYVIQLLFRLLEHVPLLDSSPDISRNRTIAFPSIFNGKCDSKSHGNSERAAKRNCISRVHQPRPLTILLRPRKLFQMELGSTEFCTFAFKKLFWFFHSFCCLPSGF
jgi:hypothetical protein